MRPATATLSNRRLGDLSYKVMGAAGLAGIVGLGASFLMAKGAGWERFLRAYLMAFMFVLSICLGGLFFTILQHCVKAGWSVVVRRLAEGLASNLKWLWILFIPIAIGVKKGMLYDWIGMDAHEDALDKYKYYLNVNFWLLRAAVFLFIWAMLAWFFAGNSIKQDATGDVNITKKMESFAPVSMLLFALSQTYAAMDWVMSLESHWFSTMFPVYFFAASCCGFFSTLIMIMCFLRRSGRLTAEITPEHFQDVGKLLFAFGIVFWAYIAFSQYMLIWYADIPEETPWYLARQVGGWGWVSLGLLFGHFVGPFLALISRYPKRLPQALALGAAWMLAMAFIDMYWLVMPAVPDELVHEAASYKDLVAKITPADVNYGWQIIDFTLVIGLAGLVIAMTARTLGGCSLLPERDPRLHESLAFENI